MPLLWMIATSGTSKHPLLIPTHTQRVDPYIYHRKISMTMVMCIMLSVNRGRLNRSEILDSLNSLTSAMSWLKKGTPLRVRGKKGHTGNASIVNEKRSYKKNRMLNLGGYIVCQKRVQFNTNWKKGYTSRFRAKKGHTAVNVCRAELKMRRISFFGHPPNKNPTSDFFNMVWYKYHSV